MTDAWILRTAIIVAGALLLAAIYFFGRPRKPGQGRRVEGAGRGGFADGGRVEPTLGEMIADELSAGEAAAEDARQSEMDLDAPAGAGSNAGFVIYCAPEDVGRITKMLTATAGSLIVATQIVGYLMFSEPLAWAHIAGIGLILAGITVLFARQ